MHIQSPYMDEGDEGHKQLLEDAEKLLEDVKNFEYHDFKNDRLEAPKQSLVAELEKLISRVKGGWYDNKE